MTNDDQLITKYRELREFVTDMIHDDTLNESDDPETCRSALKLLDEIGYAEKQAKTEQQDGKREDKGIVITGNPVDGYRYFGPFSSVDDAMANCGLDTAMDPDWWVAPLQDAAKVSSEPAQS